MDSAAAVTRRRSRGSAELRFGAWTFLDRAESEFGAPRADFLTSSRFSFPIPGADFRVGYVPGYLELCDEDASQCLCSRTSTVPPDSMKLSRSKICSFESVFNKPTGIREEVCGCRCLMSDFLSVWTSASDGPVWMVAVSGSS